MSLPETSGNAEPAIETEAGSVLDSAGKQALSDAWQRFGCAICSTVVERRAEQGFRIELHRLVPGSRGGKYEVDNIAGLCGSLLPNRCHQMVTEHFVEISFEEVVDGYIWTDTRTGEEGLCRSLGQETIDALKLDRVLPSKAVVPQVQVPFEAMPSEIHREEGLAGAQERFKTAHELVLRAERTWLALCLLVQASLQLGDDVALGFESKAEWAEAVGIDRPMLSKMRIVATQLQGAWLELPREDLESLSFMGLYYAAKMVRVGAWDIQTALHEAVAKPVAILATDWKGVSPMQSQCVCERCGFKHWATEQPEKKAADAVAEATL